MITALDFRREDFGLFRDLLGEIMWYCPGWKSSPGELVDFWGTPLPSSKIDYPHVQEIKQRQFTGVLHG